MHIERNHGEPRRTRFGNLNAPYSKQLDAQELVHCLLDETAAKAVPGHMSVFLVSLSLTCK